MTFITCYDRCSGRDIAQGACTCTNRSVGHPVAIVKPNTYVQMPSLAPLLADSLSTAIDLIQNILPWPQGYVEHIGNWVANAEEAVRIHNEFPQSI